MRKLLPYAAALTTLVCLPLACLPLRAQSDPAALQALRAAVASELHAAKADTSNWTYLDESDAPGKAATYRAVETPNGELRRMVALNGKPLTPDEEQHEVERIQRFLHDPAEQARTRKNNAHDDAQATAFLKMLPDAFIWTFASQTPEQTVLHYTPDPNFQPPSLEARVLAVMAGELTIVRNGDRIQSLSGHLTRDVLFGFGIFGRMERGGTFNVKRSQVAPGYWEITENHVHIGGHVLLFKDISQNADEVKTHWAPSTDKTLDAAAHTLGIQP